ARSVTNKVKMRQVLTYEYLVGVQELRLLFAKEKDVVQKGPDHLQGISYNMYKCTIPKRIVGQEWNSHVTGFGDGRAMEFQPKIRAALAIFSASFHNFPGLRDVAARKYALVTAG